MAKKAPASNGQMSVAVEGKMLVIRMPIKPAPSSSGKTTVIASTRGNKPTGIEYEGNEIILGVNAYHY